MSMESQTKRVRSDVDDFPTIGEAIDEAILRAEGGDVVIHKADCPSVEECDCEPVVLKL